MGERIFWKATYFDMNEGFVETTRERALVVEGEEDRGRRFWHDTRKPDQFSRTKVLRRSRCGAQHDQKLPTLVKPGHTIFFKGSDGYRKAVVHMAVGFDPNEKGHAINLTSAVRINALSEYEDFNIKQGRDFVDHEKKYMNSNSKLYERS